MSYDQVKDRTSSAVGTEEDSGALFDETIAAYSARRKRAEEFLSEALADSHRKTLRAYLSRPQWTTIADDTDSYQLAITPELEEPLRVSFGRDRSRGRLLTAIRFSSGTLTFSLSPSEQLPFDASGALLWRS